MDVISKLPDSILISIISQIQTDEAVRTSILSKRWSNLYKSVSRIQFVCYNLVDRSTYCDLDLDVDHSKAFLDICRFLQLHSGPIHSFNSLCCLTKSSAQAFEQSIRTLGKLGIEELYLYLSCRGQQQTDVYCSIHLLLHMPSLKHLELGHCSLQPSLKQVEFHYSLNTLKLFWTRIFPGSLECILSTCLNLYTLIIGSCQFPSSPKVCFRGPPGLQLKCLMIQHCEDVESIELDASNLVTFELYSTRQILDDDTFNHVPKLQNIYLGFYDMHAMPNVCRRIAKDLPNLKSFLYETRVYDVNQANSSISMSLINTFSFSCLKLLWLDMCCRHKINLLSLTPLLHCCPLLHEFHLAISEHLKRKDGPEVDAKSSAIAPPPHTGLKNVGISGFRGSNNEIEFALYILKSAVKLEQMHISSIVSKYTGYGSWRIDPGPTWTQDTHKEIQEQLKDQAVSSAAQITVQLFPRIKWKSFTNYGILVEED